MRISDSGAQPVQVREGQAMRGLHAQRNTNPTLTRFLSSTLLPFLFSAPILKPNSRKKGALFVQGRNPVP